MIFKTSLPLVDEPRGRIYAPPYGGERLRAEAQGRGGKIKRKEKGILGSADFAEAVGRDCAH